MSLFLRGLMYMKIACILSALFILLLVNCSDDGSREGATTSLSSTNSGDMQTLRIVLKWSGDDFASEEDLETRNKIEDLIVKRAVGKIIRVGTGMGWMDIALKVENKEDARVALEEIISEVAPGMKFAIE
jgi:hypothetical protein